MMQREHHLGMEQERLVLVSVRVLGFDALWVLGWVVGALAVFWVLGL
jgi:hypothetical protein